MNEFEESAVDKPMGKSGLLGDAKKMLLKMFHFIEMMIIAIFESVYRLSSNSLIKAISKETFGILFEIFVYLILAFCCILISVMIQAETILNESKMKQSIEFNVNTDGDRQKPAMISSY